MNNHFGFLMSSAVFFTMVAIPSGPIAAATYRVIDTLAIDTVPSWFPVGFCLLTHKRQQYVAYYNAQHEMVVARRQLGDRQCQKTRLPSKVGWDSHNYVEQEHRLQRPRGDAVHRNTDQ